MIRALLFLLALLPLPVTAQWEAHFTARMGILNLQAPLLGQGRVLLVGDSNTEAFWWSTVGSCNVLNAGMGGATSFDIATRAPAMAGLTKPSLVHVMIGTNDLLAAIPPATIANYVGQIIAAFKAVGAKVVVWPIPPLAGVDVTAANQALATVANTNGAYWDWWWPTQLTAANFVSDGIHLAPSGQISRYYRIETWRQYLGVAC